MSEQPCDDINKILAPEILDIIFTNFSFDEQIVLSEVCQLWQKLIFHRFNTLDCLELDESRYNTLGGLELTKSTYRLFCRHPNVFSRVKSIIARVSTHSVHHIFELWSRMEDEFDLQLYIVRGMVWYGICGKRECENVDIVVPNTYPGLRSLHYRSAYKPMADSLNMLLSALRGKSMKTLTALRFENVSDEDSAIADNVFGFIKGCQNLTAFTLYHCRLPGAYDHLISALPKLTRLKRIDLRDSHVEFDVKFFQAIQVNCAGIEFVGVPDFNTEGKSGYIAAIKACSCFKEVAVTEFICNNAESVEALASLTRVKQLWVIEQVDVTAWRWLATTGRSCDRGLEVESIDIFDSDINDEGLKWLMLSCTGIGEEIRADDCQHITSAGVARMISALHSSQLPRMIGIRYSPQVNEEVLLALLSHVDICPGAKNDGKLEMRVWNANIPKGLEGTRYTVGKNNNIEIRFGYC